MILLDERRKPCASWEFDADIAILTHSTTIQPRYQAVIHAEIVRQVCLVRSLVTRLSSMLRSCAKLGASLPCPSSMLRSCATLF